MLFLILWIICEALGMFAYLSNYWKDDIVSKIIWSTATTLCAIGISAIITFFAWIIVDCFADTSVINIETHELAAMSDTNVISRCPSEDGMQYVFLIETEDGFKMETANATKESYINFTEDDDTPYVDIFYHDYKNKVARWLLPNETKPTYCFYIPEGSIADNYNIDLS
jgi:hypothetical protein